MSAKIWALTREVTILAQTQKVTDFHCAGASALRPLWLTVCRSQTSTPDRLS